MMSESGSDDPRHNHVLGDVDAFRRELWVGIEKPGASRQDSQNKRPIISKSPFSITSPSQEYDNESKRCGSYWKECRLPFPERLANEVPYRKHIHESENKYGGEAII